MANNRLYIVDKQTGEKFLLAKSYGDGWYFFEGEKDSMQRLSEMNEWLTDHDTGACCGNSSEMKPTQLMLITENEEE